MAENSDVRGQLREAILRGAYAPRQRLIEADLAEEYAASRFVLRNALIALAAEGLIELRPNRGARIREISVAEAIEITEVRRAVESLVASIAAERVSDAQISTLRTLGDEMAAAVESGRMLDYSDLNARLHSMIREIAHHDTAARVITQLNGQMVRHQFRLSLFPGRPEVSLGEHLAIVDAVCNRNPDAAHAAMTRHVTSVIATLRAIETSRAEPSTHP